MKKKTIVKSLILASILPFCSFMVANDNIPEEEQITLRKAGGNLQVDKGAIINMPLGTIH